MDQAFSSGVGAPIEWEATFRREASAVGWPLAGAHDESAVALRIVGFTPESPPQLLVVGDERSASGPLGASLWVAGLDGARPSRLAIEAGGTIGAVEPAPVGHRIAYEGIALPRCGSHPVRGMRIGVTSVRGGQGIVATEARSPGWSADGRTLLFLRRGSGGWQPSRSHLLGGITPATPGWLDLAPDADGPAARFRPDGRQVAGVRAGRVVTLNLDSTAPTTVEHAAAATHFDAIAWSPDGQWLYLRRLLPDRIACPIPHLALHVADGRKLNLAHLLRTTVQPAPSAPLQTAAWLPELDSRLVALTTDGLGWILDLAAGTSQPIAAAPLLASPLGHHLHLSPTTLHAALGSTLFPLGCACGSSVHRL